MTRTPMKNFLLTALHWLICCTISAGAILIQLLLSKPTGETMSSFIFMSDIYQVNPLMWTLGAILGVAGIAAVMRCLLRYDLRCCLTHKKGWQVLWIFLGLFGIVLMVAAGGMALILRIGLFGHISFGDAEPWVFLMVLGVPFFALAMFVLLCIKAQNKQHISD